MNTNVNTETTVIANTESEQAQETVQTPVYDADYYTEKAITLFDSLDMDKGYTYDGIIKNVKAWLKNKESLFNTLRNHPNWNEEAKAIIIPSVGYERAYTDPDKRRAIRQLCDNCFTAEAINLFEKRTEGFLDVNAYLFYLVQDQFVDSETVIYKKVEEHFPEVKIHHGQKSSRVINKIFKVLGVDKHPDYNKYFAALADTLNPLIIKRTSILSANWLDFMTMSIGNSWTSCHSITHNAIAGGCNRAGCLSYGTDSVSLIFYTIEDDNRKTDFYAVPKVNRQVVFWQYPVMVQERLYPQCHDCDDNKVSTSPVRQIRNLLEDIMATCVNKPNLWETYSGLNIYREEDCFMYEDWDSFPNWVVKIKDEEVKYRDLYVGSDSYCLRCGNKKYDGDDEAYCSLYCEDCGGYNRNRCDYCGEHVRYEEDLHWCEDTDEYRCEDCCIYCDYHERWESYRERDMYYIENYGYICEDAYYNGDFYCCDHCGNYFYRDNDASYDVKSGRYYEVWCEDCVDRDAIQCDECGAIYDDNNRNIAFYDHNGHIYCEECAEDMDILVACEYCGCTGTVECFKEVDGMYFCSDYCVKEYTAEYEHEEETVTANCGCE